MQTEHAGYTIVNGVDTYTAECEYKYTKSGKTNVPCTA